MKLVTTVALLLSILGCNSERAVTTSNAGAPKWAYKLVFIPLQGQTQAIESRFNELGKEGWELCAVDAGWQFFKRRQ